MKRGDLPRSPRNVPQTRGLSRRAFLQVSGSAAVIGHHRMAAVCGPSSQERVESWSVDTPHSDRESRRFLIKASFGTALTATPRLSVNGGGMEGVRT